jgi:hypothetical protein
LQEDHALAKGLNINDKGVGEIEYYKRTIALLLSRYNKLKNGEKLAFISDGCEKIAMEGLKQQIQSFYEPALEKLGAIYVKTTFET